MSDPVVAFLVCGAGAFLGALAGGYLGVKLAKRAYATRAEMLELGRHLLALQDAFIAKFKPRAQQ